MSTDDSFPPPRTLVIWAALFEGGLGVLAITLGWWFESRPEHLIRWTLPGLAWGIGASLPPLALVLLCIKYPVRPFADLVRTFDELLVPLFRGCAVWELAVISLLAGFGEELLFRGIVQHWTAARWGTWIGLAGASILFGLLHPISITYAVLAGLIGLYLGGLWIVTDNLLAPIVTHAVYDFLVLVYLVRIRPPPRGITIAS